jgi:hypothetical protein
VQQWFRSQVAAIHFIAADLAAVRHNYELKPDSEIGMGSARGPRAGLGGLTEPSSHTGRRISTRESLWDKVFGGPPKTARQRRALPLRMDRD